VGWKRSEELPVFLGLAALAISVTGVTIGVALSPLITRGLSEVATVMVEKSIPLDAVAGVSLLVSFLSCKKSV
jgi:hypothetical protein